MLKVVSHEGYLARYPTGAVETPARIRSILGNLKGHYPLVVPEPASKEDLLRVHSADHLVQVQLEGKAVRDAAALAAGGALCAAWHAWVDGSPYFAAVRPPGHHAGRSRFGGYCFFNNVAVAILALLDRGGAHRAAVIDFDMHRGDGTAEIFDADPRVRFLDVSSAEKDVFVQKIERFLESLPPVDIIGVSAGFDMHVKDWGGLLTNRDYHRIGRLIGDAARRKASGRVFAVLEGGYMPHELGKAVLAFCKGLEGKDFMELPHTGRP